nr:4'-phosphopantetheinyl transferase superfamily protein [Kitasatospora sp. SID7827]
MTRPEDRAGFVAVWAGIRRAVAGYLGAAPGAVRLERAGGGRSGLRLAGVPGEPVFLSSARSGELWLLGLAVGDPLGVDLEHVRPIDTEGLAGRCLAPPERRQVRSLGADARRTALLRAWTRKEALMKAADLPAGTDPRHVVVHPAVTTGTVRAGLPTGDDWTVRDLRLRDAVQAALARPLSCTGQVRIHDTTAAGRTTRPTATTTTTTTTLGPGTGPES